MLVYNKDQFVSAVKEIIAVYMRIIRNSVIGHAVSLIIKINGRYNYHWALKC
jgi:hypothetical protein